MKIFRAEPTLELLEEPEWARSTHKGWAIVRAKSEESARWIAVKKFGKAQTRRKIGEPLLPTPWNEALVTFTELKQPEIEEAGYTLDGEEGILDKER